MRFVGKVSWFGGPYDEGVGPDEGLAFVNDVTEAPYLFLPEQPEGTTGLARRLNPQIPYVACRWDYTVTPKEMLLGGIATIYAPKTGLAFFAAPADWGPHEDTGRVADVSSGLLQALGLETDDEVEVMFPVIYARRFNEKILTRFKRHGVSIINNGGNNAEVEKTEASEAQTYKEKA